MLPEIREKKIQYCWLQKELLFALICIHTTNEEVCLVEVLKLVPLPAREVWYGMVWYDTRE
jgi:hypothetical protein